MEELDECHMPQRLLLHRLRVQPLSTTKPAALTACSMVPRAYRPWFPSTKVAVEQRPEDGARRLLAKPKAAELHLELPRHVAVGPPGRAEPADAVVRWLPVPRGGARPKPRRGQ